MTQVRKLNNIPRKEAQPRTGFHQHGDLHTKQDLIAFIEGYARRMRSLARNRNIPRAQNRVAQQNAGAALRLLNAVRPRSESDLLKNPVDVFAELRAIVRKEASASGLAPESADLEAPEEAPQGEDLQDTGGEPELE